MIIIGHDLVPYKAFYWVKLIQDLDNTPPNSNVIFAFDNINYKQLISICKQENITYAVDVHTIREVLLANASGAAYIIMDDITVAKEAQALAEHYLFDAKIILRIADDTELKLSARFGIDGVLFRKGEI